MDLTNRQNIHDLMAVYGIAPQKRYGQNFLTDRSVLDAIVAGADIGPDDTVLEIGPGLGALTARLSESAGHVVAVEIDTHLIPVLKGTLADLENVTVLQGDIMKTDIEALKDEYAPSGRLRVVANLPYYITTPVILMLLGHADAISDITVMIQQEVAERMQTGPGSKDYGALSLAVQYYAEPRILCHVPRQCFYPAPGVDSVVIHLALRDEYPVQVSDPDMMFTLIRATFNQRRKTLPNALTGAIPGLTRDTVEQALDTMGLSRTIRGEVFDLSAFARLTDLLT